MALPRSDASPEQYHRSGMHLEAMLELEDSTADLVASIAPHNETFSVLIDQDKKLQAFSIKAYARLLWADNKLDNVVRDLSGDLKKLDRNQPTLRAHERFFPEGGFAGVIQPSGRAVSLEIENLRSRFAILNDLCAQAPEIGVYLPRLEEACKTAETALSKLQQLDGQRAQIHTDVSIARNAWRTVAYQIEGELNRRFPGRKDLVRDFFYIPSASSSNSTDPNLPTISPSSIPS